MRVQLHVPEDLEPSDSVLHDRMYGELEHAIRRYWQSKSRTVSRWHALAYAHVYVRGDHLAAAATALANGDDLLRLTRDHDRAAALAAGQALRARCLGEAIDELLDDAESVGPMFGNPATLRGHRELVDVIDATAVVLEKITELLLVASASILSGG